eukprot:SAG31_NODE_18825_length_621_cov_1.272031_1_plen_174_part_00
MRCEPARHPTAFFFWLFNESGLDHIHAKALWAELLRERLGQPDEPCLGSCIDRLARIAAAADDAPHIDDGSLRQLASEPYDKSLFLEYDSIYDSRYVYSRCTVPAESSRKSYAPGQVAAKRSLDMIFRGADLGAHAADRKPQHCVGLQKAARSTDAAERFLRFIWSPDQQRVG